MRGQLIVYLFDAYNCVTFFSTFLQRWRKFCSRQNILNIKERFMIHTMNSNYHLCREKMRCLMWIIVVVYLWCSFLSQIKLVQSMSKRRHTDFPCRVCYVYGAMFARLKEVKEYRNKWKSFIKIPGKMIYCAFLSINSEHNTIWNFMITLVYYL